MDVFSSYKLYKQGTQAIINWLATTATQCGYESLQEKKRKKNRNKNKNRKLKAKGIHINSENQAESSILAIKSAIPAPQSQPKIHSAKIDKILDGQPAIAGKYTITNKELPLMATFIAEHFEELSDIDALPRMLEVIEDVIVKRRQCAKAFQQQDPSTLSSNERHQHFVTVLEEVQQILVGVMEIVQLQHTQPSDKKSGVTSTTSINDRALNNMFTVLKLEDPADVDRIIPEPSKNPQSSTRITATYELEEEVDIEEVYFKIHCFFNDFVDMRNNIRKSWEDYASGVQDLVAVAVTTNVALEMLQRAEAELIEGMPENFNLTSYEEISGLLYRRIAHDRGVDVNARQGPDDMINEELKDVADFTALPIFIVLSSFLPALQDGTIPVLKPGFFGEKDLSGRRLSWLDQLNQHMIILSELVQEFCIISRLGQPPPILDELSRGLLDMIKTQEIPAWLVFGCQFYLDIHHVMISHPTGGLNMAHKELQKMNLYATQSIQSYAKFSESMSIKTWPKANDEMLEHIRVEIEEWINKDIYFLPTKDLLQSDKPSASMGQPYGLFSRQPLLCGLMQFRLNMNLQEVGIGLVNAWGCLPNIFHPYNAAKHELNDFPQWKDLEVLIRIHGKERIFVGDYPDTPDQYFKRFSLVQGWSASLLAPNRRGGRSTAQAPFSVSKRGPRLMTVTSAITDIFAPQYCNKEARADGTFHRVQELLRGASEKQSRAAPFLPVPFLAALQTKIQDEVLELNIDYFSLHMRCTKLLRGIHSELHSDFIGHPKYPSCMEKESNLPLLVGFLFLLAIESEKTAEHLKIGGHSVKVGSKAFAKAAELMKELVVEEGGMEIKRVKEYCRGYDLLGTDDEEKILLQF